MLQCKVDAYPACNCTLQVLAGVQHMLYADSNAFQVWIAGGRQGRMPTGRMSADDEEQYVVEYGEDFICFDTPHCGDSAEPADADIEQVYMPPAWEDAVKVGVAPPPFSSHQLPQHKQAAPSVSSLLIH